MAKPQGKQAGWEKKTNTEEHLPSSLLVPSPKVPFAAGSASCVHTSPSPPLAWCRAGVQSGSVSARDEGAAWGLLETLNRSARPAWMSPGFGSTAGRCWVSLRWQHRFVWQEARVQVGSEPCLTCCVFHLGKLKQEHTLIRTAIIKLPQINNLNTTELQQSPPTPCTVCQKFGFFFFFLSGDDKTGYVNIK